MSILNKLKFLFGMIKFEVMLKGKDGKDYVCDDLEVGKELYVQTDAETITIVPDGDYAFEDGTMIKVEGGVISEVTKEETPAEPAPEAEMSAETPETPETTETPETQEPEITFNAELEIKSLKEEVERLKTALLTAVEEKEKMAKQVTELSKEPAVTSITLTTDSVEEVSHSSAVSKLMNYKKNKR